MCMMILWLIRATHWLVFRGAIQVVFTGMYDIEVCDGCYCYLLSRSFFSGITYKNDPHVPVITLVYLLFIPGIAL